jgi:Dyp-type peroxidase family
MAKDFSSKSIEGITDLVVWAPLKQGFINAFENITYESRLKLTAEALHKVRASAREHELISPFADTAERILSLLDFRIGILDQDLIQMLVKDSDTTNLRAQRFMYLVATFDGPWEPYMRLIWRPLGPFLDLLLCNCDGYTPSIDTSFPHYAQWVRDHQIDSGIFYNTTGLTVRDQRYLSKFERTQRDNDPDTADIKLATMTDGRPELAAKLVWQDVKNVPAANALGLEALTVLYKLADFYPPDDLTLDQAQGRSGDGRYLLRAAKDILLNWPTQKLFGASHPVRIIYGEPLAWFETPAPLDTIPTEDDPKLEPKEIQRGILSNYGTQNSPVTHGVTLLMQIDNAIKAKKFFAALPLDWEGAPERPFPLYHNLAFTYEGLKRLKRTDEELSGFPKEFRDGIETRAPSYGDVRENHPRRWRLPARNWPIQKKGDPSRPPISLSEIDFTIQLRTSLNMPEGGPGFIDFAGEVSTRFSALKGSFSNNLLDDKKLKALRSFAPNKQLNQKEFSDYLAYLALVGESFGVTLLGLESTFRHASAGQDGAVSLVARDHFGFKDGLSQPVFKEGLGPISEETPAGRGTDDVRLGELLIGYNNDRGDPGPSVMPDGAKDLLFNGTFLVIRKMSQNRQALEDFLDSATKKYPDLDRETIAAMLVGRNRDGVPLIPAADNSFTYKGDTEGRLCPFASHIRRTNPRDGFQGRPAPRILRRGMSYGVQYEKDQNAERGVMFMAYNASIAEQFEVIQRWINGANSTGIFSAQNDPLVGIGTEPGPRTFRFIAKNTKTGKDEVRRLSIPQPFVGLEWGLYLFVPSKSALKALCSTRLGIQPPNLAQIEGGQNIITRIRNLEDSQQPREWKRLLEDFLVKDPDEKNLTADVWAAIREEGGALRLDQGVSFLPTAAFGSTPLSTQASGEVTSVQSVVLVASWDKVNAVLCDAETYSVAEQNKRVNASFGDIYVAMDPGKQYDKESKETNEIVWDYSESRQDSVFIAAYAAARETLDDAKRAAAFLGRTDFKIELRRNFLMPALGLLCASWYDIPDLNSTFPNGEFIERGGWKWDPVDQTGSNSPGLGKRRPQCPGDFLSPSRYSFYPRPTRTTEEYGKAHGKALRAASKSIVAKYRKNSNLVKGTISKEMYKRIADDDILARNLIGIMEGMLPPTDGILRGIIYEWLEQDTLWRHQSALRRASGGTLATLGAARAALLAPVKEAMCKRPAPDLIYRTATKETKLGNTEIKKDDLVILGLVSAMQESLVQGAADVTAVFGGNRKQAQQAIGDPLHACPAQKMVMASVLGILSALLDSGRIEAQPSSLIIKISEYDPVPPKPLAV